MRQVIIIKSVRRMEIHHEHMLGVVALMLYLDMLVQRTLRPVRFVASVYRTHVMTSYLDCSTTHPLFTLRTLTRSRVVLYLADPLFLSDLDP